MIQLFSLTLTFTVLENNMKCALFELCNGMFEHLTLNINFYIQIDLILVFVIRVYCKQMTYFHLNPLQTFYKQMITRQQNNV